MSTTRQIPIINISFIGPRYVGKSSIIQQYMTGSIDRMGSISLPVVDSHSMTKTFGYPAAKLNLHEFPEKHALDAEMTLEKTNYIMLVISLQNKKAFQDSLNYIQEKKASFKLKRGQKVMVIANEMGIKSHEITQFDHEKLELYCARNNIDLAYVNSDSNEQITKTIDSILKADPRILTQQELEPEKTPFLSYSKWYKSSLFTHHLKRADAIKTALESYGKNAQKKIALLDHQIELFKGTADTTKVIENLAARWTSGIENLPKNLAGSGFFNELLRLRAEIPTPVPTPVLGLKPKILRY